MYRGRADVLCPLVQGGVGPIADLAASFPNCLRHSRMGKVCCGIAATIVIIRTVST